MAGGSGVVNSEAEEDWEAADWEAVAGSAVVGSEASGAAGSAAGTANESNRARKG